MPDGTGGGRQLKVRVKTAKRRRASSTRWLERQLNDPYVARAQREGYRARSAFKLTEIDDRFHFLSPGKVVVDLGAAPGSWSQVAATKAKSPPETPLVVGIDLLPIDPLAGVIFIEMDFLAPGAPAALAAALGGRSPDVVLSDMAASTTGHRQTDHIRTEALAEAATEFAIELLSPGGVFLAKVFQGGTEGSLLARLKQSFASVQHVKPKASRQESVVPYVLARGFKGR